mmetsp:Transcript_18363/g.57901  ORF Transcript_18363/g.57901 Transcript_18363/m.57901 type:complete len:231 (+) Transcript_18363:209-901(+)
MRLFHWRCPLGSRDEHGELGPFMPARRMQMWASRLVAHPQRADSGQLVAALRGAGEVDKADPSWECTGTSHVEWKVRALSKAGAESAELTKTGAMDTLARTAAMPALCVAVALRAHAVDSDGDAVSEVVGSGLPRRDLTQVGQRRPADEGDEESVRGPGIGISRGLTHAVYPRGRTLKQAALDAGTPALVTGVNTVGGKVDHEVAKVDVPPADRWRYSRGTRIHQGTQDP